MEPDIMAGEWKNFEFKSITEEHYPAVLNNLRDSFYKDEPTQIIMGMSEDRVSDMDNGIRRFLEEKMSFMATCKSTKKIAGVVVLVCYSKVKEPFVELVPPVSPVTVIIRSCLNQISRSVNIFEKYGVDRSADIFIMSVHRDFRKHGLATEMFRRAVEILKQLDYPIIECTFSNPFARRIGDKFGFTTLSEMRYVDAKDDEGNLLMPHAPPDQHVSLTALDVRNK